ncbi:alpha/beta fold hydrolase [Streptomyces sp. WM6378]|uniref:alpha/beta fold hydrolase n=1 Tax=Streptomyces sp. WM6378 TaxID=1415557 RepID=UPI000A4B79FE|nr:alpha/beta fold hydrolase [Streptomyces sp. WM6378]
MRDRVRTADGRILTVERSGDPLGSPVFLLHGTPSSRLGPAPRSMVLYHRRMQVIAYDRPGYGGSDRLKGRRDADAARDVEAMADRYGLERFAVVGRSGGAPHALACAALLPERVTRAAALVTLAPPDAEGLDWFEGMAASNVRAFSTGVADPDEMAACFIARSARIRENPVQLLDDLHKELTHADRMVVKDAGIRSMLLRNYQEALRTSAYGWIDDAQRQHRVAEPGGIGGGRGLPNAHRPGRLEVGGREHHHGPPVVGGGLGALGRRVGDVARMDPEPGPAQDRLAQGRPARPAQQGQGERLVRESDETDGKAARAEAVPPPPAPLRGRAG